MLFEISRVEHFFALKCIIVLSSLYRQHGSQNAPAAQHHLCMLEMQLLRPYPRPLESEILILVEPSNLCCKELSRWFSYMLNLTTAGLDLSKPNTRKKKKENDSNVFAHPMSSRLAIFNCSFHRCSLEISSMPGTVIVTEHSRWIYRGIENICLCISNTA